MGGTIFSSVLQESLADGVPVSSQKAVIQIVRLSDETQVNQSKAIASAAGSYKMRTIRALALKARLLKNANKSSSSSSSSAVTVRPKQRSTELLAVVNQPEIKLEQRKIADEVLRNMPEKCRDTLQSFYVRYDHPEHRGLAGKSVMVLDGSVPDDEFRALFIHEFGHVLDLGCHIGNMNKGESRFVDGKDVIYADDPSLGFYQISWITSTTQRSDAKPEDFVSGYASYDVFEDFAETFAYYVLQNEAFQKRAQTNAVMKAKYDWLSENVFNGQPSLATGKSEWTGSVPWDVTKLEYSWNLTQKVALSR